jgi:hypothetical protein
MGILCLMDTEFQFCKTEVDGSDGCRHGKCTYCLWTAYLTVKPGTVAYAYNPSFWEVDTRDWEDHSLRSTWAKS